MRVVMLADLGEAKVSTYFWSKLRFASLALFHLRRCYKMILSNQTLNSVSNNIV